MQGKWQPYLNFINPSTSKDALSNQHYTDFIDNHELFNVIVHFYNYYKSNKIGLIYMHKMIHIRNNGCSELKALVKKSKRECD